MKIVAVAALALLLAGCTTAPTPVPPGPTAAQVDALVSAQLTARWAALGVPAPQPQVTRVAFTNLGNWSYTQLGCYLSAGLQANDVSGDFSVGGFPAGDPRQDQPYAAQIAIYTCNAQYPVDPVSVGYLTDAQALYMYDYFVHRLAPCLELLGYAVPAAPERADYAAAVASGVFWNPYYWAPGQPFFTTKAESDRVDVQCAPLPADPYAAVHPRGLP